MDDQPERIAPRTLIDSLDASLRDLEKGAVSNARDVQAEVLEILEAYEQSRAPTAPISGQTKRAGPAR